MSSDQPCCRDDLSNSYTMAKLAQVADLTMLLCLHLQASAIQRENSWDYASLLQKNQKQMQDSAAKEDREEVGNELKQEGSRKGEKEGAGG